MKLKLLSKRKETGDVITFVFEPENPLKWIAGQYLIYNLEHKNKDLRGKMRFFTISAPTFEKFPSITTRIFDKKRSSFKNALFHMKVGEEIDAKGPDGDFVLEGLKKRYIFIAGGIGITPFHSILKQLDFEKKKVNVTLLYSNSSADFVFKNELDDFSRRNKNLKIIYYISPSRIDKKVLTKFIGSKNIFYVSGPDPMVDAVIDILTQLGVSKNKIKDDYFSGYKS